MRITAEQPVQLRRFKLVNSKTDTVVKASNVREAAKKLAKLVFKRLKKPEFSITFKETTRERVCKDVYAYNVSIKKDKKIGLERVEKQTQKKIVKKMRGGVDPVEEVPDVRPEASVAIAIEDNIKLSETYERIKNIVKDENGNLKVDAKVPVGLATNLLVDIMENKQPADPYPGDKNKSEYTDVAALQKDLVNYINKHKLAIDTLPDGKQLDTAARAKLKSKFVVITYWWGRGNTNKNFKMECLKDPPELERAGNEAYANAGALPSFQAAYERHGNKLEGKTYEQMIQDWCQTCIDKECHFIAHEYADFAIPKGYQAAINAKPLFIQKALDTIQKYNETPGLDEDDKFKGVLYIDGDMSINQYPDIFDLDNIDFMARGWNIDPRSQEEHLEGREHFDPWAFETSGGIMYFANSVGARDILKRWYATNNQKSYQGKADDRILSLVVNAHEMLTSYNVVQLPIEYLWLSDYYGFRAPNDTRIFGTLKGITKRNTKNPNLEQLVLKRHETGFLNTKFAGPIMVEHPACLTPEDVAANQGAANDRQPKCYGALIEDRTTYGDYHDIYTFYDIVNFYDGKVDAEKVEKMCSSYQRYNNYMSSEENPFTGSDRDNKALYWHASCIPPKEGGKFDFYGKKTKTAYTNIQAVTNAVVKYNTNNANAYNASFVVNASSVDTLKSLIEALKPVMQNVGSKPMLPSNTKATPRSNTTNETIKVVDGTSPVADILVHLAKGHDVIYVKDKSGVSPCDLKKFLSKVPKHIELCVHTPEFVTDPEEAGKEKLHDFRPSFIDNKPVFFSHTSAVLRHLLLMCGENKEKEFIKDLNDVFNSSFIFQSRIRCKFIEVDKEITSLVGDKMACLTNLLSSAVNKSCIYQAANKASIANGSNTRATPGNARANTPPNTRVSDAGTTVGGKRTLLKSKSKPKSSAQSKKVGKKVGKK